MVSAFLADIADGGDFLGLGPMHVNIRRKPYGSTPLKIASVRGDRVLVEALLASGADIDAKNEDEMTALHYAVDQSHYDVVSLLVRSGANLSAVDMYGKVPFDYAETNEMKALLSP